MTVRELIEKLQALNPDSIIFATDSEYGDYMLDDVEPEVGEFSKLKLGIEVGRSMADYEKERIAGVILK